MKVLHAIIALVFVVIGMSLYTRADGNLRPTPALLALLIANVSLAAISLENALDRSPVELPQPDGEQS